MRRVFCAALPQTVVGRFVSARWQSSDSADNKSDENPKLPEKEELPSDSNMLTNYKRLKTELVEVKKRIDEYKKDILYCVADLDNFRKESARSIQSAKQSAVSEFAKDMLETADDLEKVNSLCESYRKENNEISRSVQSILNGLDLSNKVLLQLFERHGIERLETKIGEKFDPRYHNQLFTSPSSDEFPSNCITKVIKNGYKMGDTVIRAAEVGVSEAPQK
ncbi:unnamed protein product [Phytomonas sp. EM1]|nr:unnamed protein product [Phytomonas sp. EM1]|eukprot:CCW61717.1 unnamed protein product [Phytomonas sp. isolate EM1]